MLFAKAIDAMRKSIGPTRNFEERRSLYLSAASLEKSSSGIWQ